MWRARSRNYQIQAPLQSPSLEPSPIPPFLRFPSPLLLLVSRPFPPSPPSSSPIRSPPAAPDPRPTPFATDVRHRRHLHKRRHRPSSATIGPQEPTHPHLLPLTPLFTKPEMTRSGGWSGEERSPPPRAGYAPPHDGVFATPSS
ncbi:hypothetical protein CONPUDRAFT_154837 [Coniophora puteana RWD-64-598 SS2]|uniref:Uncharacterized protein n=1 Tax=Coniophora puteana (strain RWD-64-598) TaxID=741705 RepID=A0A5M3MNV7_CONPW|nr:uncharacterized protein CONPUDRAFT_154837 [Coniophora puteana RWD-64-598 SS2]EIW80848.1 hypothetical protein CONPUDRAFT_154837 [Coniophora puteana RWD-64-598 SS2]